MSVLRPRVAALAAALSLLPSSLLVATGGPTSAAPPPTEVAAPAAAAASEPTEAERDRILADAEAREAVLRQQQQDLLAGLAQRESRDAPVPRAPRSSLQDGDTAPAPTAQVTTVDFVDPTRLPQDSADTITIFGNEFGPGSTVQVSGTGVTPSATSPSADGRRIEVRFAVAPTATLSARNVSVTTAGVTTTCTACFTVTNQPTVSFFSPERLRSGGFEDFAFLSGEGFASNAVVDLGPGVTVYSRQVQSSTSMRVVFGVAASAAEGARTVTVTNPGRATPNTGTGTDCEPCFTVSSVPSVSSTQPSRLLPSTPNQRVDLFGSNFSDDAQVATTVPGVTINSVRRTNDNTLVLDVTTGASTGTGTLTVRNPSSAGPQSATCSNPTCFGVSSTPVVSGTSPSTVSPGAENRSITVFGSSFSPSATVSFGAGVTVNSVTRSNASTLVANVTIAPGTPSGPTAGRRDVAVTSGGTTSTCVGCLVIDPAARTTRFDVSRLPQGVAETITLTGSGFAPGMTASFSGTGVSVDSVQTLSEDRARLAVTVAPDAALGLRDLTVTNPGANTSVQTGALSISNDPRVSFPSESFLKPGTHQIVLPGESMTEGGTVTLRRSGTTETTTADVVLNAVVHVDSRRTFLGLTITSSATGNYDIRYTRGGVTATCSFCLTVNAGNPAGPEPEAEVFGMDPRVLAPGSVDVPFIVFGSGFRSGSTVAFEGAPGVTVVSYTFSSTTSIQGTMSVSATAPRGERFVRVIPPTGESFGSVEFDVQDVPVVQTSPLSLLPGDTDVSYTLFGGPFKPGATVSVPPASGITVTRTTVRDNDQLELILSAAANAPAGQTTVTVSNGPGLVGSCFECLTVATRPTLSTQLIMINAGSSEVIAVRGAGLAPGATITLGGSGVAVSGPVSRSSGSQLSVPVTAAGDAAPGLRAITVTNPGGATAICGNCAVVMPFTVGAGRAERLAPGTTTNIALTGTSIPSGTTGTISGAGVTLGLVRRVDARTVNLVLKTAADAPLGARSITLRSPSGAIARCDACLVVTGAPSLRQSFGSAYSGSAHQLVTITGDGFLAAGGAVPTVTFSDPGVTVEQVFVASSTTLRVRIAVADTVPGGPVQVTVDKGTPGTTDSCEFCIFIQRGSDFDGDGVVGSDNCEFRRNVDQADLDGDFLGDDCDPFPDVSAYSVFEPAIQALLTAGVTAGCQAEPFRFCPDAQVNRGQMAVFLARAVLGRPGAEALPAYQQGSPSSFSDVSSTDFFADEVAWLVGQRVTSGCGGGNYCPTDSVIRRHMAAFLARARLGRDASDNLGTTAPYQAGTFTDIAVGSQFANEIRFLRDNGITTGCTATEYCPDSNVTRGQMALFLVRTFGLPLQ